MTSPRRSILLAEDECLLAELIKTALTDRGYEVSVASTGQQAVGMTQIHQAMRNIDTVARQNVAFLRQAEQTAQTITTLSSTLGRLVGS